MGCVICSPGQTLLPKTEAHQSTLTSVCPGILQQPVPQLSCTWVGGKKKEHCHICPQHLSPTCCLGSLPSPPLPSYHETLRFRTLFSSALHILVLLSHSSFLKQTQPLLGHSQPRAQGVSPPPLPHSVPGSPQLTCHLSTSIFPSPARSLHAVGSVNSVCQASGRGQAGLGSRHLPAARPAGLRLDPSAPPRRPSAAPERRRLLWRLRRRDTGRARARRRAISLPLSKTKCLCKVLATVRKLGWVFCFAF